MATSLPQHFVGDTHLRHPLANPPTDNRAVDSLDRTYLVRQNLHSRSTLATTRFLAAPQLPHAGISNTTVVRIRRTRPTRPINHQLIYQTFCAGFPRPDLLPCSEIHSVCSSQYSAFHWQLSAPTCCIRTTQ
jgi:hypothetical protein